MITIYELNHAEVLQLSRECENVLAGQTYRTLKVTIDGSGFKVKAGEGMWTPSIGRPLGTSEPEVSGDEQSEAGSFREVRGIDLRPGMRLALPFGNEAKILSVKIGRTYVHYLTEYGKARVFIDDRVLVVSEPVTT